MKQKEIFNLAIRLLGLLFLYHGLQSLPAAVATILAAFPRQVGAGVRTMMNYGAFIQGFFTTGWPLLMAFWLIRGAPYIMELAYPEEPEEKPPDAEPPKPAV
jgi:hypothetical protein